jgi:hypothetical protein
VVRLINKEVLIDKYGNFKGFKEWVYLKKQV